jgi:hypothetical protein
VVTGVAAAADNAPAGRTPRHATRRSTGDSTMAGQVYTLRFKNRSESQYDFLVFQQGIDVNEPNGYTLAWFTRQVANGVDLDFTWTVDYAFVWSDQGTLKPGITFEARQVIPADLTTANLVTFTDVDGAFQFGTPTAGGTAGSLTIDEANTIPKNMAKVGIGMSGQGTHVIDAEPNVGAVFTPHPEYWIGFGFFKQGQVLDIQSLVNAQQVPFSANVFQMTATLDSGNNWTIAQGLV